MVADSSDGTKRQRGRRGLDMLKRLQEMDNVHLKVYDKDFEHLKDVDSKVIELAKSIQEEHFPEAAIEWHDSDFQDLPCELPNALMVTNPPYGERIGRDEELPLLYREIGYAAKRLVPGGRLSVFTANRKAARQIRLKTDSGLTLFNGSIEGLLFQYSLNKPTREAEQ